MAVLGLDYSSYRYVLLISVGVLSQRSDQRGDWRAHQYGGVCGGVITVYPYSILGNRQDCRFPLKGGRAFVYAGWEHGDSAHLVFMLGESQGDQIVEGGYARKMGAKL